MEVLAAVEYVAEFLASAPTCCLLREGDGGQQLPLMQRCQRGVQFLHRMSSRFDDQSDVKSCSLLTGEESGREKTKRNFKISFTKGMHSACWQRTCYAER